LASFEEISSALDINQKNLRAELLRLSRVSWALLKLLVKFNQFIFLFHRSQRN